jgi:hypothetical protein
MMFPHKLWKYFPSSKINPNKELLQVFMMGVSAAHEATLVLSELTVNIEAESVDWK